METLKYVLKLLMYATGGLGFIYFTCAFIQDAVFNSKYRAVYDRDDSESVKYIRRETVHEIAMAILAVLMVCVALYAKIKY